MNADFLRGRKSVCCKSPMAIHVNGDSDSIAIMCLHCGNKIVETPFSYKTKTMYKIFGEETETPLCSNKTIYKTLSNMLDFIDDAYSIPECLDVANENEVDNFLGV